MAEELHAGGYDPQKCAKFKRHEHVYVPKGRAARRCTCGSRNWKILAGGPLPVLVACVACSRDNRTATSYEEGRIDAFAS